MFNISRGHFQPDELKKLQIAYDYVLANAPKNTTPEVLAAAVIQSAIGAKGLEAKEIASKALQLVKRRRTSGAAHAVDPLQIKLPRD